MDTIIKWFTRGAEFIAATMLGAMFLTFLVQIFSRYALATPLGWTVALAEKGLLGAHRGVHGPRRDAWECVSPAALGPE